MGLRIIIVGDGQLGSELKNILNTRKSCIGEIPKEYEDADVKILKYPEFDITNIKCVDKALTDADIVFNCSAYTNVESAEDEPEKANDVNNLGVATLAKKCEEIKAKLVHISTDYVFDGKNTQPYTEDDKPKPLNVYGKTKMLGETAAFLNCKQTFIIRTSWLFGYTGKNFVRTMIKFGITKGQLKVINDQIGTPTNANDLAMAMLKLALTDKYGVYHFANSGQCSWFEFANFIIKEAEIQCIIEPCTSTEYITKATRPKCSILDNRKISLIVGTIRSWQDATRDFVEKIADEIKELKHFGKESL